MASAVSAMSVTSIQHFTICDSEKHNVPIPDDVKPFIGSVKIHHNGVLDKEKTKYILQTAITYTRYNLKTSNDFDFEDLTKRLNTVTKEYKCFITVLPPDISNPDSNSNAKPIKYPENF